MAHALPQGVVRVASSCSMQPSQSMPQAPRSLPNMTFRSMRPATWTRSPALRAVFGAQTSRLTMAGLSPRVPEGIVDQLRFMVPVLLRDPVIVGGLTVTWLSTAKLYELALGMPGWGSKVALAAIAALLQTLFALAAQARFTPPSRADRAAYRIKRLRSADYVDGEVLEQIYRKVLYGEEFYVNLHFTADDDQDYYDRAAKEIQKKEASA